MSVIIQEMVSSDMSGIVFTANPQGLLNEIVVVCGKGTGDAVVEDKVPTTTYYYNKTDKIYYHESQLEASALDENNFNEIIEITNSLTKTFGEYLDIEFAIRDRKLYILQVRPITTLNTDRTTILDNSNIVESYPNITLPLTDSFISEAYYRVFRGVASRCLSNGKLVEKYDNVFREMLASANGRIYYKISNWYTVIKFLPFSKKIIPIWQEMIGVNNKTHNKEKINITWVQKVKIYLNSFHEAFNVRKGMDKLNNDFIKVTEHFNERYSEDLSNEELVEIYNEISETLLKDWDITLLNDMYAFVFTGLLKNRFKNIKIQNYEYETNKYISGMTDIESMKPIKKVLALSKYVIENASILEELSKLKNDDMVYRYLLNNDSCFINKFKEYIEKYGDRSLEELKLESKTFRSSPILLINKILEYAEDREKLKNIIKSFEKGSSSDISQEILRKCSFIDRKLVKLFSEKAMYGIKNREISRLNRSRVYGMVRRLFLSIGNNLKNENKINEQYDIFYLHTDEVFGYIKGSQIDFKNLIEKRKQEYSMYEKLPSYSRLIFAGDVFNKKPININSVNVNCNSDEMVGIPCSSGLVTGEVVVIDNPKMAKNIKDKILVTKMTDPGWVFLLTIAKGIITEKGSLLSHTAIISRELNIPSIVGVENITNILKTGDIVKMNGNTGEIQMVSEGLCIV